MNHATSTFVGIDGSELFCQSWLPAQEAKASIAIVHGVGEHSDRYTNLIPYLVERGYALFSYDQRGHGRSPGKLGHIEGWHEYREDLHLFIQQAREQFDGLPFFLFGHSMGGLVALDYALHYQAELSGLIVSSPSLALQGERLLSIVANSLNRIVPRAAFTSTVNAASISRIPETVKAYVDDPLTHAKVTPRWLSQLIQTSRSVHERAPELTLPLLMTHGTADKIVPIDGTQRFFANVRSADKDLITYKDAYHEPHNDLIHEEAARNIGDWVDARINGWAGRQVGEGLSG